MNFGREINKKVTKLGLEPLPQLSKKDDDLRSNTIHLTKDILWNDDDEVTLIPSTGIRIIFKHIAPLTIPTLITIATLDFAFVMLGESALSFLGVGIQPPEVTWGLMVAQGRNYLQIAWWLAFFPGLIIMLVALSLNLLSSWLRIVLDPRQRWRLENIGDKNE